MSNPTLPRLFCNQGNLCSAPFPRKEGTRDNWERATSKKQSGDSTCFWISFPTFNLLIYALCVLVYALRLLVLYFLCFELCYQLAWVLPACVIWNHGLALSRFFLSWRTEESKICDIIACSHHVHHLNNIYFSLVPRPHGTWVHRIEGLGTRLGGEWVLGG